MAGGTEIKGVALIASASSYQTYVGEWAPVRQAGSDGWGSRAGVAGTGPRTESSCGSAEVVNTCYAGEAETYVLVASAAGVLERLAGAGGDFIVPTTRTVSKTGFLV